MGPHPIPAGLPARTRLATAAGGWAAAVSRRVGAGAGSTVGGRVTLAVDPRALARLSTGRSVALVSGTNGKTTTTRLLAAALAEAGPVATSPEGANLLAGIVAALSTAPPGAPAVLEVDEGLVGQAARATDPSALVLLNLSRDQLDRIGEVRTHAESWRRTIATRPRSHVVANADDPLVAWAAWGAPLVTWVAAGQRWRHDAATCPACGGRIEWTPSAPSDGESGGDGDAGGDGGRVGYEGTDDWHCSGCELRRPAPDTWLEGSTIVTSAGARAELDLLLPGRFNLANATMAAMGAGVLGVDLADAARAMATVGNIAGRYQVVPVAGSRVRLLLAKNPAGWAEALDLLRPAPVPVIVGINAQTADGRDPSWLWDVPFERLAGRPVVATGERGRDLAVRLHYAGVAHTWAATWPEAVAQAREAAAAAAGDSPGAPGAPGAAGTEIDLAANYTAFQAARRSLKA